MKHLLILLTSLALFACGGGDSGGSAEEAADTAKEAASDAMESAGDAMESAGDAMEAAGDSMEALAKPIVACGAHMALTPPTKAASHSSAQMLRTAMDSATNDDEQAVSTARLGPRRPSTYDTRPASAFSVLPVA